jgi:hypothetical protein
MWQFSSPPPTTIPIIGVIAVLEAEGIQQQNRRFWALCCIYSVLADERSGPAWLQ